MGTRSSNSGDIARAQERNRANLIKGGLSQIDAIYSGGTYGINPTEWNKASRGTYYDPSGHLIAGATAQNDPEFKLWLQNHPNVTKAVTQRPSLFGRTAAHMLNANFGFPGMSDVTGFNPFGGGDQKTFTADQVRNLYAKFLSKNGELFSGTATSPGFGPDFYNKRVTDYINFALPQVESQSNQAGRNLTYRLANQGLTKSAAGRQLGASLLEEINRQRQGVASTGIQQAQDLQRQVEQSRSNLISQLESSADPTLASQGALRTAASFSAPSAFAPIGNVFSNWANMYMASQAQQTNPSLLPYLYGMQGSRGGSSIIPNNAITQ